MVAIFTGVGMGAEQGSVARLGPSGLLGDSSFGRNGESLFLNAATGNLMIRQRDEFLAGLGPDATVARTYNSKGTVRDENGDSWRQSTDRRVIGDTTTANTTGDTVTRVSADGSEIIFTYDGSKYVSAEGEGAEDTLTYDATAQTWTFNDGSSLNTEVYGLVAGGTTNWYVTSVTGHSGKSVAFAYNNSKLETITTDSGEKLTYTWSGNNITSIQTSYYADPDNSAPGFETLKRVYYTYDSSDRLETVTIDMTPEDEIDPTAPGGTGDVFTTTYTYVDATSSRIESISQTGGAKVEFAYTNGKVTEIKQTADIDAGTTEYRITSINYLSATQTEITSPDGAKTTLTFNATTGNLEEVEAPPAVAGATSQKYQYTYFTTGANAGRLEGVKNPEGPYNADGFTTTYAYDASGNISQITNALGEKTTRVYNADNNIVTETIEGVGSPAPTLTRHWAYDALGRLRYEISPEGRVTETRYNSITGTHSNTIQYLGVTYSAGATAPTYSTINSWRASQDASQVVRKFLYHDARGQLTATRDYGAVSTGGTGDSSEGFHRVNYTYDQHGQLLSTNDHQNQGQAYTYDGMGRIISSTDINGEQTTIVFNDGALTTTVTTSSGLTTTTVYNEAGDVVSEAFSGTDVNGGTETRVYDDAGRVSWVNNVGSGDKNFFYDDVGRLVATLDNRLGLEQYKYNANNELVATRKFYTRPTVAGYTTTELANALAQKDHGFTLDQLIPATNGWDIVNYTVYDDLGRVAQTILGDGSVTSYTYDFMGRVVSTTTHINKVDASGFWASPPSALQTVTAHAEDQTTQNFYDDDGNLIGVLDAEQYFTKTVYDDAGRAISVTRYATQSTLATGTFDQIVAAVAADAANDQTVRNIYDSQSLLRYTIDAEGRITERVYFLDGQEDEAMGVERQIIQYSQKLAPTHTDFSFEGVRDAIGETIDSGSIAQAGGRTQTNIFNDRSQLVYTIDALGHVVGYTYNTQGLVTEQTAFAVTYDLSGGGIPTDATMDTWAANSQNNAGARQVYSFYNPAGQMIYSVDASGYVIEYAYNRFGMTTSVKEYELALDMTQPVTLAAIQSANLGTHYVSQTFYNGDNGLYQTIDRAGVQTNYFETLAGHYNNTVTALGVSGEEVHFHTHNDLAGRVIRNRSYSEVDKVGIQVTALYAYDGAGNLTTRTDGRGNLTTYTYDAMGRLLTETNPEGDVTTYTYDGFGRVDTVTNALNSQVDTDYNQSGQITQVTDTIAGTTSYSYGFYGDDVEITDARNNKTFIWHDDLGREVSRVVQLNDTEGLLTTTEYNEFGEVKRVTQQGAPVDMTSISLAVKKGLDDLPAQLELPGNRVTEYDYNANGTIKEMRQKFLTKDGAVVVEDVITETYEYDQLGQRTKVINALGGVTLYEYDGEGRVTKETLAATVGGVAIVNAYEYNERGLLEYKREGTQNGASNARVTQYTYDGFNRLESTIMQAVDVRSSATGSVTTGFVPTETWVYDNNDNVIEYTDASGAKSIMWYDDANRVTAQLVQTDAPGTTDPKGVVTTYTYDANGNRLTETLHHVNAGVSMATYATYSETAMDSFVSDEARTTTFVYDANNRLIETRLAASAAASFGSNGEITLGANQIAITAFEYDVLGNLVKATDAKGHDVFSYFDGAGRKVTEFDAEGYRTDWTYDALGNVTKEIRYAEKHDTANNPLVIGTLQAPTTSQQSDALNRVTSFTYDTMGRRLSLTREDVTVRSGQLADALAETLTDAVVSYTYNDMGQVLTKTEANGDVTTYVYDSAGRLKTEQRQSYTNQDGVQVTPTVNYDYDALGNLTTTTQVNAAGNRVSTNAFDVAGRLTSVTDASGFVINYEYDEMGRVTVESYSRLVTIDPDNSSNNVYVTEAVGYGYDAKGRVISKGFMNASGSDWTRSTPNTDFNVEATVYNSFGDIASKALNGIVSEEFVYDAVGRLEATSAGDGIWKFFLYDLAGNEVVVFTSSGRDMTTETRDSIAALFGTDILTTKVSDVVATVSEHNARGEVVRVTEANRVVAEAVTGDDGYRQIETSRQFNAFGDMISETRVDSSDTANNRTTDYTYDNRGKLIKVESPTVSVMDSSGNSTNQRPTEQMYYDVSGRLVGIKDANGGETKKELLAGSGHDGAGALLTKIIAADGTQTELGYDVFGDLRETTDALGRINEMTYDGMGRMIKQERFANATDQTNDTVFRRDEFQFDGMGRQLRHFSDTAFGFTGTTQAQRIAFAQDVAAVHEYDMLGRLVSKSAIGTVDAETYAYEWQSAVGGVGGWKKTITLQNGAYRSETTDRFGRMHEETELTDSFAGAVTTFTYDDAGRLDQQTTLGTATSYTYFNTGNISKIEGLVGTESAQTFYDKKTATFAYNAFGEQVAETYRENGRKEVNEYVDELDSYLLLPSVYDSLFRDATVTYDKLGRVLTWDDTGGVLPSASANYSYDAKGNIIKLTTTRNKLDAEGDPAATATTETQYNRYDAMDRIIVQNGNIDSTNGIVAGEDGSTLTAYDAVGRREVVTQYTFTSDVYLRINNLAGEDYWDWETFDHTLIQRQDYDYDNEDRLTHIYFDDGDYNTYFDGVDPEPVYNAPTSQGALLTEFEYNDAGRQTRRTDHAEEDDGGRVIASERIVTYGSVQHADRITEETNITHRDGEIYTNTSDSYDYGTGSGYRMGNVVSFETDFFIGSATTPNKTSRTVNTYTPHDSYVQRTITYTPDISETTTQTTQFNYELWAGMRALDEADINDGRSRDVQYVTDLSGQTLRRHEHVAPGAQTPSEIWYRFGGKEMGHITNNGSDLRMNAEAANEERRRDNDPNAAGGQFRFGQTRDHADFSQGLSVFNSFNSGRSDGSYTVQAGDNLRTIAQRVWGDSALWFKLAEANGLNGDTALAEGTSIFVPAGVQRNTFNANTIKPFNPGETIGNTSPTVPIQPRPNDNNCGIVGQVILIAIAVAVTYFTKGAFTEFFSALLPQGAAALAPIAGSAAAGAAGSIVSQGVGVTTGIQDRFSWNSVALAAISAGSNGAIGQGVGEIGRALISNAVTQGVSMALGWQSKFSWAGFAAAGVGGAVRAGFKAQGWVNPLSGKNADLSVGNYLDNAFMHTAAGIAGAATRSAVDGSAFDDNLRAAIPNIIGSALNDMLSVYSQGGFAERVVEEVTSEADNDVLGIARTSQPKVGTQPALGSRRPIAEIDAEGLYSGYVLPSDRTDGVDRDPASFVTPEFLERMRDRLVRGDIAHEVDEDGTIRVAIRQNTAVSAGMLAQMRRMAEGPNELEAQIFQSVLDQIEYYEQDYEAFFISLDYLNGSRVASDQIREFLATDMPVIINDGGLNSFIHEPLLGAPDDPPALDHFRSYILWDPTVGLRTTDYFFLDPENPTAENRVGPIRHGNSTHLAVISPALILLHEIAHANRGMTNYAQMNADRNTPDLYFTNMEEHRVINQFETRAAIELGEPTRYNHWGFQGLSVYGEPVVFEDSVNGQPSQVEVPHPTYSRPGLR